MFASFKNDGWSKIHKTGIFPMNEREVPHNEKYTQWYRPRDNDGNHEYYKKVDFEQFLFPNGLLMVPLEESVYSDNFDGPASDIWYVQLDWNMLFYRYGFNFWEYNGRKALQMQEHMRVIPTEAIVQVVLKGKHHQNTYKYWCLYRHKDFEKRTESLNHERQTRNLRIENHEYIMNVPETLRWNPRDGWNLNRQHGLKQYEFYNQDGRLKFRQDLLRERSPRRTRSRSDRDEPRDWLNEKIPYKTDDEASQYSTGPIPRKQSRTRNYGNCDIYSEWNSHGKDDGWSKPIQNLDWTSNKPETSETKEKAQNPTEDNDKSTVSNDKSTDLTHRIAKTSMKQVEATPPPSSTEAKSCDLTPAPENPKGDDVTKDQNATTSEQPNWMEDVNKEYKNLETGPCKTPEFKTPDSSCTPADVNTEVNKAIPMNKEVIDLD